MREFEADYSQLSNGVRVLKIRVPNDELTAITVCVDTGSRNDLYPEGLSHALLHQIAIFNGKLGITHEVEHYVFKGTEDMSERELNLIADGLPSDWSARTDEQKTIYYLETFNHKAAKGIDLLARILADPSFPEEPVETEKKLILDEIRSYRDDEPATILETWKGLLFKGSAMATPILGNEESVAATSRQDIVNYHDKFYRGNRMLVIVTGNTDGVDDQIAESFGKIKPGEDQFEGSVSYGEPGTIVMTDNTDQAHFVIGVPGVAMNDERYCALKVIEVLLGGHTVTDLDISIPSSKIYNALRVESGTAYEVTCKVDSGKDSGYLAIQGQVEPSLLIDTLNMVKKQMFNLSETTEEEFENAKNFWELYFLKIIKNNLSLAYLMGEPTLYFGTIIQPEEMIRNIQSVTLEDVKRVAQELIREDQIRLAVLGPFDQDLNLQSFEK